MRGFVWFVAGDQAQGLAHARQMLHLSHTFMSAIMSKPHYFNYCVIFKRIIYF